MEFHNAELEGIRYLHTLLKNPITDAFFIGWNYVDTLGFIILFVSAIWQLVSRKEGVKLLFIFMLSGIFNLFLKAYFGSPRPCHIDPSVGILCYNSLGFPSGGAQSVTIIAGVALGCCREKSIRILAILFAFFVYFSRVYLGLHFFTDILGGIAVGLFLLFIYFKVFPFIENHWDKFALALSAFFLGVGLIPQSAQAFGFALGLSPIFSLEEGTLQERMARFLCVTAGSFVFVFAGEYFSDIKWLFFFLASFWFSFLGGFLVSKAWKLPFACKQN